MRRHLIQLETMFISSDQLQKRPCRGCYGREDNSIQQLCTARGHGQANELQTRDAIFKKCTAWRMVGRRRRYQPVHTGEISFKFLKHRRRYVKPSNGISNILWGILNEFSYLVEVKITFNDINITRMKR